MVRGQRAPYMGLSSEHRVWLYLREVEIEALGTVPHDAVELADRLRNGAGNEIE